MDGLCLNCQAEFSCAPCTVCSLQQESCRHVMCVCVRAGRRRQPWPSSAQSVRRHHAPSRTWVWFCELGSGLAPVVS